MISYDLYSIDEDLLYTLLAYIKKHHLRLKYLHYRENHYYFYIPVSQRYYMHQFEAHYIKTIGLLNYVLLLMKPLNLIGTISFILTLILCSHLIFDIQIIGTVPNTNQHMIQTLHDNGISFFTGLKSYEELNDLLTLLKETYTNDIEYLNVYQTGSVFYVEYTKRTSQALAEDDYRNIYASKDGLIAYFDIDSGFIEVDINDYVSKGDLLVSNEIISTSNETKIIPVKGHVYAYTYNDYEISIDNHNQDYGDAFYELLLKIRSQIPVNAMIDKENVLQMSKTSSTITLKMHYTLLEDIGTKET